MSDGSHRGDGRRPVAFRVEDVEGPRAAVPPAPFRQREAGRAPRAVTDIASLTLEPEDVFEPGEEGALEAAVFPSRRFSFAKLFFGALGALVSIAVGLAVDSLVRDLFARADWLGWTALGLAALLAIGAFGIVVREAVGLMRLAAVDRERKEARRAYDADSAADARRVVAGLVAFLSARPETAEGRARLRGLDEEVVDGRDMIVLAERELLVPLDIKVRALVLASAKRVSIVTAASPKAIVDVSFVLFETVRLIRRISELYGARPGTIGLVKLTRDVLGHLAVTGSISIGDGLLGQVVGHGIAAKLSARLGEGVVNGLLTARVGLAAMDLCRPLPFIGVKRPKIGDFLSGLASLSGDAGKLQGPLSRPFPERR